MTVAPFAIEPLERAQLDDARVVLAAACAFDDAAAVAGEKLCGDGPTGAPVAWLARTPGGELIGVCATNARWLRMLAVVPAARGRGVGSALLARAETELRGRGVSTARALAEPGNYLAPGIDERNAEAIAWLERRGWTRGAERNANIYIDVRSNPRVSEARAAEAAGAIAGYEIRRARLDEQADLTRAIELEFGGAWPFEAARSLAYQPAGVHVAIAPDGSYAGFAAHDGNNQGLGWFGPTGTWPAHRGKKLGEALLLACLVDVAARHDRCEVAWIGPRPFYEKVAGVIGERRFWPMAKDLRSARPCAR